MNSGTADALLSYDWPANVRELQNCIERMVAMNSGPLLQTADLPSALQNHLLAHRPGLAPPASGEDRTARDRQWHQVSLP
ncbi:MAG: hypothetical protein DMG57_34005 [Acidobacteria bacterium]|nr:MAG: hypothetical protein DMG57_34005 [Acidobacteriota bacterium]